MILYFRYIGQRKSTEQKIPAEHILPPPQKRDNSRIVSKKKCTLDLDLSCRGLQR